MIQLKKIDAGNVWDIVDLKVAPEQEDFVAPNNDSIIEAYTTIGTGCTAFPFAVYNDETPVGFVMIGHNMTALGEVCGEETPPSVQDNYLIWRLMIDAQYQGQGYGRAATQLALDFINTQPCGRAEYCVISYEPENTVAQKLYASFGFVETDERDGSEIIAVLKL